MKRLRNSTQLPDDLVREVEAHVMPPGGVGGYDVELRNHRYATLSGRAYYGGSGYHSTARPFVVLRIGDAKRFPRPPRQPAKAGYLPMPWIANQEEALVFVMAHELRHLWQHRVPKGRRVWGSRGQFSERDADAYAIRKLREWRRRG